MRAAGLLHDRPIHAAHQTHIPPPAVFHVSCHLAESRDLLNPRTKSAKQYRRPAAAIPAYGSYRVSYHLLAACERAQDLHAVTPAAPRTLSCALSLSCEPARVIPPGKQR